MTHSVLMSRREHEAIQMESIEVGALASTPTATHRNLLMQSPMSASDSGSPLPPDLESSMEAGIVPELSPSRKKTGTRTDGDGTYTRI